MLGRKPITLVEIDLPYCSRSYGVAPCAAVLGTTGNAKCFNSRFTCQDATNYSATTKTVTFAPNIEGLPDIAGLYPALRSVSARPGELNLSGIDPRTTAMGKRARVTVELQDFTDNDTWLDKYQSERISGVASASGVGYRPQDRGRFLNRLMARFPYYNGIPIRVRRGYIGDDPGDMPVENYVIDGISGPDASGKMTITAKDVLDLAENRKAVCPAPSSGKLSEPIRADATTATLTPDGIGDAEYPASGTIRIGRELMRFTRSGDVLTLTRGIDGTEAADHDQLDLVQRCAVFENQRISEVIAQLLTNFAGIDSGFIDTAAWEAENDTWLTGLNVRRTIISKPTGVAQLVGELCQLGVLVWWDAEAQEIRYKVNAPLLPGESYYPITDEEAIIEGTPDVNRAEDQRISALWFYHGVRDWTDDPTAPRNFDKLTIGTIAENPYGQPAYKEIYMRWFGAVGDDAAAGVIAERLVNRYKNTPRIVSGMLDVKDRAGVSLGARIIVETYVLQDIDGATLAVPMQVNYAEYTGDDRISFRAEEYRLDGRFGFWLDDGTAPADYTSATDAQKATGAFWGDATSPGMPDGSSDYVWF